MNIYKYSNQCNKKNKIPLTCLQGNCGDSLGEFSNTSYGVFGAERVNITFFSILSPAVIAALSILCHSEIIFSDIRAPTERENSN